MNERRWDFGGMFFTAGKFRLNSMVWIVDVGKGCFEEFRRAIIDKNYDNSNNSND